MNMIKNGCLHCGRHYSHKSPAPARALGVTFRLGRCYCMVKKLPKRLSVKEMLTERPDWCPIKNKVKDMKTWKQRTRSARD